MKYRYASHVAKYKRKPDLYDTKTCENFNVLVSRREFPIAPRPSTVI